MAKIDKLRIVLVGGTRRTLRTLQAIIERPDVEILMAIFQRDYPWDPQWHMELEKLAEAQRIPFVTYNSGEKVRPETIEEVNRLKADAIIGGGNWRAFLPPEFWQNTRYGFIGLHGSLLPEYRGFANINWYIINGEADYGMQMFRLDENIDNGHLVYRGDGTPLRKFVSLRGDRTISDILDEVEQRHIESTLELIECLRNDDVVFIKQDEQRSTWTCHRGSDDGEIDWAQSTSFLHNFIRAQSHPYTGAFSFYRNQKFHIWRASIPANPKNFVGRIAGKIVDRHPSGFVDVLTGDSILRIEDISVDGESMVPNKLLTSVRETLGYTPRYAIEELQKRIKALEDARKC